MASIVELIDALADIDGFDIGELPNLVNQRRVLKGKPPLNPTRPPVFEDRMGVNDPFRAASALNQVTNVPSQRSEELARAYPAGANQGYRSPQELYDIQNPVTVQQQAPFSTAAQYQPPAPDTRYDIPFNPGTMVPTSTPNYPQYSQGSVNGQSQQIDLMNLPGYYTPQQKWDMQNPSTVQQRAPFSTAAQYQPPVQQARRPRDFMDYNLGTDTRHEI